MTAEIVGVQNVNYAVSSPKIRVFIPKFGIFGGKFSDTKQILWQAKI